MLRRSDILGIFGFIMMAAGAILFLADSGELLPFYWLLGTVAWFAGFGVFLGWICWRAGTLSGSPAMFHRTHRKA